MALAPKLQLRQGQKLAITPQLRQAIKLLQLSNIELSAFVDEQLEKNPLLERGDGSDNRRLETLDNQPAVPEQTAVDTIHPSAAPSDIDMPAHALTPDASPADMGADVGGSIDWSRSQGSGSFNGSQDYDPAANSAAEISLTDHIRGQIGMLRFNVRDRLLAEHLIGQLESANRSSRPKTARRSTFPMSLMFALAFKNQQAASSVTGWRRFQLVSPEKRVRIQSTSSRDWTPKHRH